MFARSAYFIAELGHEHNGKTARLVELLDACLDGLASGIKLQWWTDEFYVAKQVPEELQRTRLSIEQIKQVESYCKKWGLDLIITCHNVEAYWQLKQAKIDFIPKVGSGSVRDYVLLSELGRARPLRPVIMSTGMQSVREIKQALTVFLRAWRSVDSAPDDVTVVPAEPIITLLHCKSIYPCPPEHAGLLDMEAIKDQVCLDFLPPDVNDVTRLFRFGYSDHTRNKYVVRAAVQHFGAEVVEMHLTLPDDEPTLDKAVSYTPSEYEETSHFATLPPQELDKEDSEEYGRLFPEWVKDHPEADDAERALRDKITLVAVARHDIKAGEMLTVDNIYMARPAGSHCFKFGKVDPELCTASVVILDILGVDIRYVAVIDTPADSLIYRCNIKAVDVKEVRDQEMLRVFRKMQKLSVVSTGRMSQFDRAMSPGPEREEALADLAKTAERTPDALTLLARHKREMLEQEAIERADKLLGESDEPTE